MDREKWRYHWGGQGWKSAVDPEEEGGCYFLRHATVLGVVISFLSGP
jgi:hypothetical protein